MNLYEKLMAYDARDVYPFHMPGHKRNTAFLSLGEIVKVDITEIDGFDNMHHPEDIIKEAQQRAARLFGADETWFLINGSSSGLISAILGCCEKNSQILIARNCHKSVYNAIDLGDLNPIYMYPELLEYPGIYQGVSPKMVQRMLERYPNVKAVVLTSPTYEGIVSDIKKIAEIVHAHHIPLIVDEAHGAHFGLSKYFPKSAVSLGADIVIQSMHKTLPTLTQTALIHLNGSLVDRQKVRRYYDCIQTTSPSYPMMASMDHCITLLEEKKDILFEHYWQMLKDFYVDSKKLSKLGILGNDFIKNDACYDYDLSKIVIYLKTPNACGNEIYHLLLEKYRLQMEMASRDYLIGMTSMCDRKEGFDRLASALKAIDQMNLEQYQEFKTLNQIVANGCEVPKLSIHEALESQNKCVPIEESCGLISAEYAYIYPPGVPFLTPGEMIKEAHLNLMKSYVQSGLEICGLSDESQKTIKVINK